MQPIEQRDIDREYAIEQNVWDKFNEILKNDHEVKMTALAIRQQRLAIKKTAEVLAKPEMFVLKVVRKRI